MLVRMVSILLILILLATSCSASVGEESQQTIPEMRKVALKAVEKNRQVTLVLKMKRDNKKKFTGRPSDVSEQGLTLTDTSSGHQSQFNFDEVREVRKKSSHVGLYVGIGVAAVAIVVLAALLSALSSD